MVIVCCNCSHCADGYCDAKEKMVNKYDTCEESILKTRREVEDD